MYNCPCCTTERMSYMEILDENSKFEMWSNQWAEYKLFGASYTYTHDIQSKVCHINNYVGNIIVQDVKPMHLNNMVIEMAKQNPNTHKPSSKKLLKEIKCVAVAIFEYIIENSNIKSNPATKITIPKNTKKSVRRSLTKEEQNVVLNIQHKCHIASLIMMLCGLRTGELIPLRWEDVDIDNKTISINKSVYRISANKYGVKSGTKNGNSRIVPIPDNLLLLLKEAKESAKYEYITYKRVDGSMHTPSSWRRLWESYLNKTKIAITPHMLRHTYATLLYSAGVDVLTASKLMGHSDIDVTLRIYTHLERNTAQLSINKLNEYMVKEFIPGVS